MSLFPQNIWNFPFSGRVDQDFSQILGFGYKGTPEIERRVLAEADGYGGQLGTLIDVVAALIAAQGLDETNEDVQKFNALKNKVATIKSEVDRDLRDEARAALETLRRADARGFAALMAEMRDPGRNAD